MNIPIAELETRLNAVLIQLEDKIQQINELEASSSKVQELVDRVQFLENRLNDVEGMVDESVLTFLEKLDLSSMVMNYLEHQCDSFKIQRALGAALDNLAVDLQDSLSRENLEEIIKGAVEIYFQENIDIEKATSDFLENNSAVDACIEAEIYAQVDNSVETYIYRQQREITTRIKEQTREFFQNILFENDRQLQENSEAALQFLTEKVNFEVENSHLQAMEMHERVARNCSDINLAGVQLLVFNDGRVVHYDDTEKILQEWKASNLDAVEPT